MPEPFKNLLNEDLIERMAAVLLKVDKAFDRDHFETAAKSGLEKLEMMARSDQISMALDGALSGSFEEQLATLIRALHPNKTAELSDMETDASGIAGWAVTALGRFVVRHGMHDPELSLNALREMTMRFSSEFAVRPFILEHPKIALDKIKEWSRDPNHHVRRLASEGTRPLLPWGLKLHPFVKDPTPMLPILMSLRDDPSDYVRKSVANHLNDISKNQPDLVAEIAGDWLKDAPPARQRLVKHACRGLIKSGHPKTLMHFGYGTPALNSVKLDLPKRVTLGDTVEISLSFVSTQDQNLLIDYIIHFVRANGSLSPKVFKWTEKTTAAGGSYSLVKRHPYKKVTTRKDYPGQQVLSVQVNGEVIAQADFEFVVP